MTVLCAQYLGVIYSNYDDDNMINCVTSLHHKSNLETLLYRYFIICLYKYVIIYCKDTFCGTLESVTCIKTLFEAF